MTDLATITGSLEQCYDAIESLAARMGPQEWHGTVAVPGLGHARCHHAPRHDGTGHDRLAAWRR